MYSRLDTSGFTGNSSTRRHVILKGDTNNETGGSGGDSGTATNGDTQYIYAGVTLRNFCLFSGMLNFFGSIVIISMWAARGDNTTRLKTPITNMLSVWSQTPVVNMSYPVNNPSISIARSCSLSGHGVDYSKYVAQHVVFDFTTLPVEIMLFAACLWTGMLQIIVSYKADSYYSRLLEGKNLLYKFYDLSVSGPFLALVVCSQLGVTNFVILFNTIGSIWASMMFFLMAEVLIDQGPGINYLSIEVWKGGPLRYYMIAQLAGDVMLVFALMNVISNSTVYSACVNANPKDNFQLYGQVMSGIVSGWFLLVSVAHIFSMRVKVFYGPVTAKDTTDNIRISGQVEFFCVAVNVICKLGVVFTLYYSNLIVAS
jgi:hypothetical protein